LGAALPATVAGLLLTAGFAGSTAGHGRVTREGGTFFLPERVMHTGYAWIDLLARAAGRLGLGADAVSWLSLGLGLVAGGLVAAGWLGGAAWALARARPRGRCSTRCWIDTSSFSSSPG
jgi:hypothetical protein